MSNPFLKYDGLTYRELRYKFAAAGMPEAEIDLQLLRIREFRSVRNTEKKRKRALSKQWGEVIAPLQHERRILRAMLRYKTKTPAPERDEFVEQYFNALTTVYERLCKKRDLDKMLPEHSHWTDYVPEKIKWAFIDAANAVPPRDKAKFKEPFQRTSPIALSALRRGRLLRYTRATLEALLVKQDVNGEDPRADRKEKLLRLAIDRIKELPPNAHVPNHWADMVRDKLNPDDDLSMADKVVAKPPKRRGTAPKLLPGERSPMPAIVGNTHAEQMRLNKMMITQPLNVTLAKLLGKTEKKDE